MKFNLIIAAGVLVVLAMPLQRNLRASFAARKKAPLPATVRLARRALRSAGS